jgi:hypothetical protein
LWRAFAALLAIVLIPIYLDSSRYASIGGGGKDDIPFDGYYPIAMPAYEDSKGSAELGLRQTLFRRFKKSGRVKFHIDKWKVAAKTGDGALIEVYADGKLVGSMLENPYADPTAQWIDDTMFRIRELDFAVPPGTHSLSLKVVQFANTYGDGVKIDVLDIFERRLSGYTLFLCGALALFLILRKCAIPRKVFKAAFVAGAVAVIFAPALSFVGMKESSKPLFGFNRNDGGLPDFSFKGYASGKYQRDFEKQVGETFFGRRFFYRLGESLHFVINGDRVSNGDYRLYPGLYQIYHKKNFRSLFRVGYERNKAAIDGLFTKTRRLQDKLESRGKKFLFVLGSNPTSYYEDNLPFVARSVEKSEPFSLRKHYADGMKLAGVHLFDESEFHISGKATARFPIYNSLDVHLNYYGGGELMLGSLKEIEKYYGVNLRLPEFDGEVKTASTWGSVYGTLNLFPGINPYIDNPDTYYRDYTTFKGKPLKIALIGDSWTNIFLRQLKYSRISDEHSSDRYANGYGEGLPPEKVREILDKYDIVIIVYSEMNLPSDRIAKMVESLLKSLE